MATDWGGGRGWGGGWGEKGAGKEGEREGVVSVMCTNPILEETISAWPKPLPCIPSVPVFPLCSHWKPGFSSILVLWLPPRSNGDRLESKYHVLLIFSYIALAYHSSYHTTGGKKYFLSQQLNQRENFELIKVGICMKSSVSKMFPSVACRKPAPIPAPPTSTATGTRTRLDRNT